MEILLFLFLGGGLGFLLICAVVVAKQFIFIARPCEVLVVSGRQHTMADGSVRGYRTIHGGWIFRYPLIEKVDQMDLRTIPVNLSATNAYSKGNIALNITAVAYVKVSSDPALLSNAVERFLGQDRGEIHRVAKESLEGHIRGVIATMTPEEMNEDRLRFSEQMLREAGEDLDRLGITLDAIKIQSVADEIEYLDSIGRERLAKVISAAEIAESTAKAEAQSVLADAQREGTVATELAETAIVQAENSYRTTVARLEATARSEEERAEQAGIAARAQAEQKLQEVRTELEHLRLNADIVLPAEAQKKAEEYRAQARASVIAADGQAMAEVLDMMTETWALAGDDAKDIFLIQQLETVLTTVISRVQSLQLKEVTLIDDGSGDALAQHIAALPKTVAAVLRTLRDTTGVDITEIINPTQSTPEVN